MFPSIDVRTVLIFDPNGIVWHPIGKDMRWDKLPKWIVKDPIRKEFVTTFKYRYVIIIRFGMSRPTQPML